MKKTVLFYAFFTLLFITSCQKDIISNLSETSARTLTPEQFDWEHIDHMPIASSQTTQIPVPWGSGANKEFPDAFLSDWKKSDGWELVYNTFSTIYNYDNKYFILYNKYRGTLRGYFWVNPSTPIPSRQVVHEIKFNGALSNSPLVYAVKDVVDFDSLTNVYSEVQPYTTPSNGAWYAAEIPLNYVPNMSSVNEGVARMTWNVYNVNITQIDISGTSTGTLTGNLTTPAPAGSNLFASTLKGGITGVSNYGLEEATKGLKLKDSTHTPNIFKSFAVGILSSGIPSVGGIISSLLSGIFSGSGAERKTVTYASLKSSSNFKFTGTLTDNYSLSNPTFVTPGTIGASTTSLYAPLYNKQLGIFSLVGRPTANISQTVETYDYSNIGETDERAIDTRSLYFIDGLIFDTSSYSIAFNPDVINTNSTGATITNLKKELLISGSDNGAFVRTEITTGIDGATYHVYNPSSNKIPFTIPNWSEQSNIIPGGIRGTINDFNIFPSNYNSLRDKVYLRVSFNVEPNNGTSPVTAIVQTFKVKLNGAP